MVGTELILFRWAGVRGDVPDLEPDSGDVEYALLASRLRWKASDSPRRRDLGKDVAMAAWSGVPGYLRRAMLRDPHTAAVVRTLARRAAWKVSLDDHAAVVFLCRGCVPVGVCARTPPALFGAEGTCAVFHVVRGNVLIFRTYFGRSLEILREPPGRPRPGAVVYMPGLDTSEAVSLTAACGMPVIGRDGADARWVRGLHTLGIGIPEFVRSSPDAWVLRTPGVLGALFEDDGGRPVEIAP